MQHRPRQFCEIERAARRAWPAAEERHDGEWLLRFGNGYTKRANSAYITGLEPDLAIDNRIEATTAEYRARGLPLIVRETSLVIDPRIGASLLGRGYRQIDETIVMTAPIEAGRSPIADQVDLDTWLTLHERFEGGTKGDKEQHREILARIVSPACFGVLRVGNEPVALGLAVADGDWVGLYDIVTDPKHRRRGYGRALVQRLLAWANDLGATSSYLFVVANNAPARVLYDRLGYREAYRYWYWVTEPG